MREILIAKALRDKTFDVIEHAVFMFEIEGIAEYAAINSCATESQVTIRKANASVP